MGNILSTEITSPANPTRKAGWTGIGCDNGIAITFGARKEVIEPTRKLVLKRAAGTVARFDRASGDDCIVIESPVTIITMDANAVTKGPLIATSKRAVRDLGKDLNGVIHPNVPICKDGRGTGRPSLTSDISAAI
mmetsp:Transcript_8167/g.12215  ORF Transcript_8167/g.12215 Transcript_8167/m.12215 type:complete len:135 (+) Transcript_8167:308-712(+)